jgi:ubiquinone/menaquinone biosynthesis C-methylase UbiE
MTIEKADLQAGYDRVAEHYATEFFEELERKPFDCQLLDQFAKRVSGAGIVCELGCGPGQVARYLKDRGVDMCGVDLSPEMVKVAGRLNPDISFSQGDMSTLNVPDESLAAIVLFYSIIHIQREAVTLAFREMSRVLTPTGNCSWRFTAVKENSIATSGMERKSRSISACFREQKWLAISKQQVSTT